LAKRESPFAKQFSGVTRLADMADLIKADEAKMRLKKVPEVAEEEEHHPDIDIRFNKVRLVLSTHSKGGLTDLDFALAERIDTLSE
jgi:pterin-4a-carbinolamine dehydratase